MLTQPSANLALSRYDFAADRLRRFKSELPSNIVYDLGPGDGRMRSIEQDGFVWRGFDLTAWDDVAQWDLSEPCPDLIGKAGAVLLLDVIEHCVNPGRALKNIAAVMAPDARIIMTMPNPRWSGSRFHMLFFGTASGFTQQDLDENHHVFVPWPHILEKLMNDAGFEIDEYVTLNGWTTPFARPGNLFLPARYMLNCAQMIVEAFDRSACGFAYGLTARKRA